MRVVLLALVLLLAGCAEPTKTVADDDPFTDLPSGPTVQGKGLIRGVVVDTSIVPVEGAAVVLTGSQRTETTNEAGAFVFNDLDPGTYFLAVSKIGYNEVQHSASVEAGIVDPPAIKVLLKRVPGSEPRAVTVQLDGLIVCSIGEPTNDHSCDTTGDQVTQLQFDFTGKPDWVQTEIEWDSTQPAGENLYVIQGVCGCDGRPDFGQRFDESSKAFSLHVARADPDFLDEVGAGDTTHQVWVDVSSSGPELGTGIALDQEFSVYTTFFYNMEPNDDWTFFQDGAHPVPR